MTAPKRLKRAPMPETDTETPVMYRGGGAVNDMIGTAVTLKGGTQLKFMVGHSISPTVEDVRYIFKKLYTSKYMRQVVPVWAVEELLVKASVEQINTLVPAVLLAINDILEYKEYEAQDLYFLCVSAYVLAWFDHLQLGGPRPIIESEREKRMVKSHHKLDRMEIVLRCEYCNKVFTPPANLVRYEKVAKAYLVWLPKHYWEYHKWASFRPSGKATKKES